MNLNHYLTSTLDILFRPFEENGFWNRHSGSIIRAIEYRVSGNSIKWTEPVINDTFKRYPFFCMMGVMHWRSVFNKKKYDEKIKKQLDFSSKTLRSTPNIPSYALGPMMFSFSKAYKIFKKEKYLKEVEFILKKTPKFKTNEDTLMLLGIASYYEIKKTKKIKKLIEDALEDILKHKKGNLFVFDYLPTRRHQNQMYTIWSLSEAIRVTGKKEYLRHIEDILDYTIKKRMLKNGGIVWEDVPIKYRVWEKIKNNKFADWDLFYECHQTFFINSVFFYKEAGGRRDYSEYVSKAFNWITNKNPLNRNLIEVGHGIPIRVMNRSGDIEVPHQTFKGSYEIGSYIMALSNMISGEKLPGEEFEELIKRWVKQPKATPLVQYLRDTEKTNALRFIKRRKKVIDIASESNLTLGIDAKHITRVDVSLIASNLAKKILGKTVNKFVIINPSNPVLSIPNNSFDAAVSIGPYDWLFLDVYKLTDEVYKVLADDGIFVFSVPTIKSPYCIPQNKKKLRYYTVEESMKFLKNSQWHLKDFVLIYQPPGVFYSISSRVPLILQKIFVKICYLLTRYYTYNRLWNRASYIMFVLEKGRLRNNENKNNNSIC